MLDLKILFFLPYHPLGMVTQNYFNISFVHFCFRKLSNKTGVLVCTGVGPIFWGLGEGLSPDLCGESGWVGGQKYLTSTYR